MAAIPFVVPFGRDGAADRAARAFASRLGAAPGRTSPLVENVPGAGGLKGLRRANAIAASGHPVFLLSTPTTHVLLAARWGAEGAPDPAFEPLLGFGSSPNVLLASPRLGIRSVEALIARARSESLSYASAGEGQTIHACTALFCLQAGIRLEHRPYDAGSAAAYNDLAAGRVHVHFDNLVGCRDRIAAGDAVALAVSSVRRSAWLQEVPTLIECGFPDHALDVWLGVFGAHVGSAAAGLEGPNGTALGGDLDVLGLSGGPLGREALADEVRRSGPGWKRALEAALASQ